MRFSGDRSLRPLESASPSQTAVMSQAEIGIMGDLNFTEPERDYIE